MCTSQAPIIFLFTYQYDEYQTEVYIDECDEKSVCCVQQLNWIELKLWRHCQNGSQSLLRMLFGHAGDVTFKKKIPKERAGLVNFWICWIFLFPPHRKCHRWLLDTSFIRNPRLKISKRESLLKPKWLAALASQLIHPLKHSQISLSSEGPPRVVVVVFSALRKSERRWFLFLRRALSSSLIISCYYLDVLSGNRWRALKGRWGWLRYG